MMNFDFRIDGWLDTESTGRGICLSRGPMQLRGFVMGWEAAFGRAWSEWDDLWCSECLLFALATVVCVACREYAAGGSVRV